MFVWLQLQISGQEKRKVFNEEKEGVPDLFTTVVLLELENQSPLKSICISHAGGILITITRVRTD